MRIMLLSNGSIHLSGNTRLQQPSPEGLGAWETIPFPSQMAAEGCHHKYRFAYGRWFFRRNRCFVHIATQRFPLDLLKEHCTRHLRRLSTEHCQIINPPRYHHIHAKTGFEPIGRLKLTVLNPAATFE